MAKLTAEECQQIYEDACRRIQREELRKEINRKAWITLGCTLAVGYVVITALSSAYAPHAAANGQPSAPNTTYTATAGSSTIPEAPAEYEVKSMAEKIVTDHLKAPSTADFSPQDQESITQLNTSPYTYRVTGWVDAQNGFGAKIRSVWVIKMHDGGDKWFADSVDIVSP